jgi:hypothetical protein
MAKNNGFQNISLPTKSPEQMDLLRRLIGSSLPGMERGIGNLSKLAGGGDEAYWNQLEAPAFRQFGQMQGDIASRFSGMGMGAQKGSGFGNEQNSAAMEFAEKLQSNRIGMQQDAISQLLGMSQSLLGTETHENVMIPPKQKSNSKGSFGSSLGSALGGFGSMFGAKKFGFF